MRVALADPARTALTTALARTETAGRDPRRLLAQVSAQEEPGSVERPAEALDRCGATRPNQRERTARRPSATSNSPAIFATPHHPAVPVATRREAQPIPLTPRPHAHHASWRGRGSGTARLRERVVEAGSCVVCAVIAAGGPGPVLGRPRAVGPAAGCRGCPRTCHLVGVRAVGVGRCEPPAGDHPDVMTMAGRRSPGDRRGVIAHVSSVVHSIRKELGSFRRVTRAWRA
ncbi:hypothetical protein SNE510_16690 [Streptomyces sp. NE5-10]|nr:hypothetical protein SNE510_16690 [Streptomyces sp. NE5-10]